MADVASGVLRRRAGRHLCSKAIPKVIPIGAELVGGPVDSVQEYQLIRLICRRQGHYGGVPQGGQCVEREHLCQSLGLAAVQVRRVIAGAQCQAFPFSWLRHPQYVGTVLTIWGLFLTVRFPHDDWYVLPVLETVYYAVEAYFEQ